MKKPTLLVLAAGMGSRYGGLKQMDPVGPAGETMIDYSVFDAMRAGFGKLVFVIRRDIEEAFREIVGSRFDQRIAVEYVFQEMERLPAGYTVPPGRTKPWGTAHAILAAEETIQEPFAAINADDFYGTDSYRTLAQHLQSGSPDYAMVGFVLRNTLSEFGSVARGVCELADDGYLKTVTEITKIEPDGNGAKYTDTKGALQKLTGDELVSMNMWGFHPSLFAHLRREFSDFLAKHGHEEKSECYIPSVVGSLVESGREHCQMLRSNASWFGVTYREDRERVVASIRSLISRGEYPEKLWA